MFTEYRGAKTVTIHDVRQKASPNLHSPSSWRVSDSLFDAQVSHSLRRLGTAVYGFDGDFSSAHRKSRRIEADFEDAVEEL